MYLIGKTIRKLAKISFFVDFCIMQIETSRLKNGIRIVHARMDLPVSYCGIAINTGTRDQLPQQSGMAHFVEHTLFKGTTHRTAGQILNRLESVGGNLDAYTTKEETFLYATVLTSHHDRALELIADIVFHPTFPQRELEKEKHVIVEEIQSYNDSPSELIFDHFEDHLFHGSGLGFNILGDPSVLLHYTSEEALAFVQSTYHTDQMEFFSLSSLPTEKVFQSAEKYLGSIPANLRSQQRIPPKTHKPFHLKKRKPTHQCHLIIGSHAPHLSSPDYWAFFLLNNLLGGPGMNSRLNLLLRERNGLAYTIESSFVPYSDSGVCSIYVGSERKTIDRCSALILHELKCLREKPLAEHRLSGYKRQLLGQMTIGTDNHELLALNIAKSLLHTDRMESIEEIKEELSHISPIQLCETANKYFQEAQLSSLLYY